MFFKRIKSAYISIRRSHGLISSSFHLLGKCLHGNGVSERCDQFVYQFNLKGCLVDQSILRLRQLASRHILYLLWDVFLVIKSRHRFSIDRFSLRIVGLAQENARFYSTSFSFLNSAALELSDHIYLYGCVSRLIAVRTKTNAFSIVIAWIPACPLQAQLGFLFLLSICSSESNQHYIFIAHGFRSLFLKLSIVLLVE